MPEEVADGLAGVAGLPEGNNDNGCDTKTGPKEPAESTVNPNDCRTFPDAKTIVTVIVGFVVVYFALKWLYFALSLTGGVIP